MEVGDANAIKLRALDDPDLAAFDYGWLFIL